MVFSSLRSRNRHSANPNPRLHMPMLRNNRDKDLIRSSSGSGTPVISSSKGGFTLTSPGRPPLGFATPPLDPLLQSPLQSPLVFPSLKSVQPVQPVPPFYRTMLSPPDIVSPPVSLPTSPILPTTTNSTSIMDQHQQILAVSSSNNHISEALSQHISTTLSVPDAIIADATPKKKPRKSSMPVKIEKDRDIHEDFDDKDDFDDDDSCHHRHPASHQHNNINGNCNNNNNSSSGHQSPSQDEMTEGTSELHGMDSFTSEDQDHERDFENESETSESKMFYREDTMEVEDQCHGSKRSIDKDKDEGDEEGQMQRDIDEKRCSSPSPHQPVIKIKEELNDPTYDMFCMGQYGLYNGGMAAAAAAAASMAALHESFISSMAYGSSSPKFHSQSPDGELCSSPDPKICYVCKKSFKSSYSVKLHYKNVHLKEMHVCTVAGCNAAFPSRRSRDRRMSDRELNN